MQIRAATENDVPALKTLLRKSWLTTWAPELEFATVQRFAATDPAGQYAEDKWREFAVADDNGVIVGMFHVEGDHLHAIHLDPGHKRQRVGSLLMDEVERRIAVGYPEATLEVLTFNTGAIAFYLQRGWTKRRSTVTAECGQAVEAIEMAKVLKSR